MKVDFIHLSDLHYRQKWDEQVGFVLDKFFEDLAQQINQSSADEKYLIFSGDFVQSGGTANLYSELSASLGSKLDSFGIPPINRITVPGNHDVSQDAVEENIEIFTGLWARGFNESSFNNYIAKEKNAFVGNFANYLIFEKEFARYGITDQPSGAGHLLPCGIGVYCMNTAICSGGGAKDEMGNYLNDVRKLSVETRNAYKWAQECTASVKILVTHHPLHWLTPEAENSVKTLISDCFDVHLSGHEHTQGFIDRRDELGNCLCLSAPALFTKKNENLGYAILRVDSKQGAEEVKYRQWTTKGRFVAGVSFAANDSGTINVRISESVEAANPIVNPAILKHDSVGLRLRSALDDALISYAGQPKLWVQPTISTSPETSDDAKESPKFDLKVFLKEPSDIIVKAPPQFGLTCFGRYLAHEAWTLHGDFWLYLDGSNIRHFKQSVIENRDRELAAYPISVESIRGVIIDCLQGDSRSCLKTVKA